MKVSVFRRGMSYLLDFLPLLLVLSLLYNLFVGDIIKPDNYDQAQTEYQELQEYYFGFLEPYEEQYNNGEITMEEYQAEYDNIVLYFNQASEEQLSVIANYFMRSIMYYVLSYTLIYYLYSGLTQGRTIGRRLMKLELGGTLTWWKLFVREVVWKIGFWVLTFGLGGIMLDIAMISFSKRKLTSRDIVSGLYVKYEGVDYPF